MKIKVYMIVDFPLGGLNAGATHVQELFQNLTKLSDIILFEPKGKKKIKNKNVKYIFAPSLPVINHFFFNILLFLQLLLVCKRKRPDCLYVRHSIVLYSHILISKIMRIPFIIEVNGLPVDQFINIRQRRDMLKTIAITMFSKLSEKLNYKHAYKIIAVTFGIKEYIKTEYNIQTDKILVINNGVNCDLFKPMEKSSIKKELKLEDKTKYICFVGSLISWQGVEYLINAAPLILKENPNTKFIIIGSGMLEKELIGLTKRENVSDNFIFTGAIPYKKVPQYINASDICVVYKKPLKSGYSPLKLYEYMACGVPVVASRLSGFEILEESKSGILVEPENPKKLAKAIIKLLKDKKLREKMGDYGRNYVVKHHSWKAISKKIERVIESALEL